MYNNIINHRLHVCTKGVAWPEYLRARDHVDQLPGVTFLEANNTDIETNFHKILGDIVETLREWHSQIFVYIYCSLHSKRLQKYFPFITQHGWRSKCCMLTRTGLKGDKRFHKQSVPTNKTSCNKFNSFHTNKQFLSSAVCALITKDGQINLLLTVFSNLPIVGLKLCMVRLFSLIPL